MDPLKKEKIEVAEIKPVEKQQPKKEAPKKEEKKQDISEDSFGAVLNTVEELKKEQKLDKKEEVDFSDIEDMLAADSDQPEKNIRIRFDGPMSLFDSTTKYGIRLACFLPTALAVEEAKISASLIWGKRPARKVIWEYHGSKVPFPNRHRLAPPAHPEIKGLHKLWQSTENDWELEPSDDEKRGEKQEPPIVFYETKKKYYQNY